MTDHVVMALRVLRHGVPGHHPEITDETTSVWASSLDGIRSDAVVAAAVAWVENEPRFPSLSEFREAVAAEARAMARRALVASPYPGLPEPERLDDVGVTALTAIRNGLRVLRAGGRYRDGVDAARRSLGAPPWTPPAEPTAEFAQICPAGWLGSGPHNTVACHDCGDTGWVERDAVAVHPCGRCRPGQHERWRRGHYAPGHDCGECQQVRKGRAPAYLAEQ